MMSGRPWYSDFSVGEERGVYKRRIKRGGVGYQNYMRPSLIELLWGIVMWRYCIRWTVYIFSKYKCQSIGCFWYGLVHDLRLQKFGNSLKHCYIVGGAASRLSYVGHNHIIVWLYLPLFISMVDHCTCSRLVSFIIYCPGHVLCLWNLLEHSSFLFKFL